MQRNKKSFKKENNNDNNIRLVKKHKLKYFDIRFALGLIDYSKKTTLHKSYWNTYHCSTVVKVTNGKFKTKYCKNRWCSTCNRIRTAQLINGYMGQIEDLKEPYFVTLTLRTVHHKNLNRRFKTLTDAWRKIYKLAKQTKRKNFKGIRKMEVNLSGQMQVHPHFHFIIEGKENAEWLYNQWLKRFPRASKNAQNYKPAIASKLVELFKYSTKLITDTGDLFASKERSIKEFGRLDMLFRALKGRRTYQPFGGIKRQSEDIEEKLIPKLEVQVKDDFYIYKPKLNSWLGQETKQLIFDFKPSKHLKKILQYCPNPNNVNNKSDRELINDFEKESMFIKKAIKKKVKKDLMKEYDEYKPADKKEKGTQLELDF